MLYETLAKEIYGSSDRIDLIDTCITQTCSEIYHSKCSDKSLLYKIDLPFYTELANKAFACRILSIGLNLPISIYYEEDNIFVIYLPSGEVFIQRYTPITPDIILIKYKKSQYSSF